MTHATDRVTEETSKKTEPRASTGATRSTGRSKLWIGGCIALGGLLVLDWAAVPAAARFRPPTSPLDNVAGLNETTRLGWGFLWQAKEVLPAGSTYTVVAGDPQTEMSLYMLSLGVLTDSRGLPTSYYLQSAPEVGATARFVLVYGCGSQPADAKLLQKLDDGCVWDRGER